MVTALAIVGIVATVLFLGHRPTSFSGIKGQKQFNYVLITVDTFRADRIGCYGYADIETPYMDLFARRDVKIDRCISQTPLTLPSHTSLLTGTYPTFHGVRDNGGFLESQDLITLAELCKNRNYRTSAFVAAYVLDPKWEIDQGFDIISTSTTGLEITEKRAKICKKERNLFKMSIESLTSFSGLEKRGIRSGWIIS